MSACILWKSRSKLCSGSDPHLRSLEIGVWPRIEIFAMITCNYIIFLGATQERRTAMTEDSESEVCCRLAMAWIIFGTLSRFNVSMMMMQEWSWARNAQVEGESIMCRRPFLHCLSAPHYKPG